MTLTGSTECLQGYVYKWYDLPGFNDRAESVRGYSNCNVINVYEHINLGGAVRTCYPNCNTLESLNNQVSSVKANR